MSKSAQYMKRNKLGCTLLAVFAIAVLGRPPLALSAPECRTVEGHLNEHVTNPSPLQVSGPTTGFLSGTYDLTLLSLSATQNPAVQLFTGNSVIHTHFGDLNMNEAGAIDFGTGNLSVLWTVVSGTDKLKNATGQIFAAGNFDAATGTGLTRFRGEVCTP